MLLYEIEYFIGFIWEETGYFLWANNGSWVVWNKAYFILAQGCYF